MRQVTRIETSDGVLHANLDRAIHHAERRYADALSRIAAEITALDWKFTSVRSYIDNHHGALADLRELKADIDLVPSTEEEG